ncbi:MAG: hypothetical protein WCC60_20065 [Ilumatobacteraceae bacterium]
MTLRLSLTAGKALEGLVVGAAGAALGWSMGAFLHPLLAAAIGLVAAVNGLISGWRGIYSWRQWRGVVAFVLDSTWATMPVGLGMVAHVVGSKGGGYEPTLSHRQNRHVYRSGVHFQAGFALTIGNVISSAGDVSRERRRKLITDHEGVHVWQARWFGPAYLPLYGLWAAAGALGGVALWWRRGRKEPIGTMIEACSYYLNPFEWWAYSRDDLWPPPGLVMGVGWRKPAVRPLAAVRARRHADGD